MKNNLTDDALKLYENLSSKIGEITHTGDWFLIDQQRINQFANVTEDQQWIHTNPEKAINESPFKSTIAHGFLTISLLPVLTDSVNPSEPEYPNSKMTVNFGLDKIRFPYPVRVNSEIRAVTKIASVNPIKNGLEIVKDMTIEIKGVRRPACTMESIVRVYF